MIILPQEISVMKPTNNMMLGCALFLALAGPDSRAAPLGFEQFPDSYAVTNEIAGLAFSGATVLTAGVSLNELDYPPTSGVNVLAALSGMLNINLSDPAEHFSAYFTYAAPLTFTAFDIGLNQLFSVVSPTASNLGANYLFSYSAPAISSVTITSANATPFTVDDVDVAAAVPLPEPGTLGLLALGALCALSARRQRRR
jgi:hypothetical protein